jgi:2-keto-4-pentenoate hydratase/2-oxohepta-3-ene-1,7-dioic acid hydratase in catechol pathway
MTKYVRYRIGTHDSYGILNGETVRELQGDLFQHRETGATHSFVDVKLLPPSTPSKILAVGLNYRSHLNGRPAPSSPEIFYKPPSCLIASGDPIQLPKDAKNVHSEGELVIVIGPNCSIFGVTCGNDISERDWQHGANKDLQWWRAKGSDTFGPLGPAIVTGIDFSNLLLQTRINGETVQKQYTSDLMFDCPTIVKYVSQWVTLQPGDVIYTGTPGSTKKMNPGDIVEVEIEGIGVLRNRVI